MGLPCKGPGELTTSLGRLKIPTGETAGLPPSQGQCPQYASDLATRPECYVRTKEAGKVRAEGGAAIKPMLTPTALPTPWSFDRARDYILSVSARLRGCTAERSRPPCNCHAHRRLVVER